MVNFDSEEYKAQEKADYYRMLASMEEAYEAILVKHRKKGRRRRKQ